MMRQDRFTEQAQKVLSASQELVRRSRQSQWDVEHVLVALATEGGLAAQIFEALQVDSNRLAAEATASPGGRPQAGPGCRAGLHHAARRQDAGARQRRSRTAQG